jgi:hypothetical protein
MSDTKFWSKHVAASRASGLTRAEYARREGIAVSALQYWTRKVEGEPGTQLVRVARAAAEPVRSSGLLLEVQGVRVLVGPDFDRELLARVIDVLRERAGS